MNSRRTASAGGRQRRASPTCFTVRGQKPASFAFLGAWSPALNGASMFQPLHLPAPIMGVMSAHPSLSQGTPRAGCLSAPEVLMRPRSMPAKSSCRHKVPFSIETGNPLFFQKEGLASQLSDWTVRVRSDTLTSPLILKTDRPGRPKVSSLFRLP